jgi:hypothetical protein
MREYKAKRSTVIFSIGFLAVLTVLSVVGLVFAEPRWFFVVILFALAFEWYRHLKAPVSIRVVDDGSMEFHSFLGRRVLAPTDIKRIRRAGRYCTLEHVGGSINLYSNMEGLEEFVSGLREANSEVDVKTFKWGQSS